MCVRINDSQKACCRIKKYMYIYGKYVKGLNYVGTCSLNYYYFDIIYVLWVLFGNVIFNVKSFADGKNL